MLANDTKIVSALVEALEGDPFYVAISCDFGDVPARRTQVLMSYFDYSMTEGFQSGRCVTLSDVLGAAIWSLPASAEARAEKRRFVSEVLGKRGLDNFLRIV